MSYGTPTPQQLALREEIRAQYHYLVARDTLAKPSSSHALAAKNMKKLLAANFPGQEFSCKSSTYSGGSSVYVYWDQGREDASTEDVDALVFPFGYNRFDGMTDSTSYDNDEWRSQFRELFGSVGYVITQPRPVSPQEQAQRDANRLAEQTPTPSTRRRSPRL